MDKKAQGAVLESKRRKEAKIHHTKNRIEGKPTQSARDGKQGTVLASGEFYATVRHAMTLT